MLSLLDRKTSSPKRGELPVDSSLIFRGYGARKDGRSGLYHQGVKSAIYAMLLESLVREPKKTQWPLSALACDLVKVRVASGFLPYYGV